jgi:hypothetical protein
MVRLQGGNTSNEGRVEVYCNGLWGTLCDDGIGENEAKKICTQLGYSSYVNYNHLPNLHGSVYQPIWFDDIVCYKGSSCISDCHRCPDFEFHNCHHTEDVTIECSNELPPTSNTNDTCYSTSIPVSTSSVSSIPSTTDTYNPSTSPVIDIGIFGGAGALIIVVLIIVIGVTICVVSSRRKKGQMTITQSPINNEEDDRYNLRIKPETGSDLEQSDAKHRQSMNLELQHQQLGGLSRTAITGQQNTSFGVRPLPNPRPKANNAFPNTSQNYENNIPVSNSVSSDELYIYEELDVRV